MPIVPPVGILNIPNATVRAGTIEANALSIQEISLNVTQSFDEIVQGNNTCETNIIISNTLPSTSATTGALTVAGGLGVAGNLYASNVIIQGVSVEGTPGLQNVTEVGPSTDQAVHFTNTTASTSATTGAVKVEGGLGVGGNVHASSNLFVTGNVGIGTTEPTETLDIVGNLNLQKVSNTASIKLNSNVVTEYTRSKKLIKYPRVAMTQSDESSTTGYVASASGFVNGRYPYEAFDNTNVDSDDCWHVAESSYSDTDGTYTGSTRLSLSSSTPLGEWLKLESPIAFKLKSYKIIARNSSAYYSSQEPRDAEIWGSNDDTNWTKITEHSGLEFNSQTGSSSFNVSGDNEQYFKYHAIIVTKNGADEYFSTAIGQWELFGIPEYDPDAHGTDVIARSVPNVPNTDLLEVYYDGQDYTSMPSSVIDKTGNGHNGTIVGDGVGFDSTYKAFTFAGSDDYFHSTLDWSGDQVHSVSFWVKTTRNNVRQTPVLLGTAANSGWQNHFSAFELMAGGNIKWYFGNNDTQYYADWTTNTWIHLAFSYTGGGSTSHYKSVYMNGRKLNVKVEPTTSTAVSFNSGDTVIRVGGGYFDTIEDDFVGSIANLRIYEKALTSDEVWQLYAYQKEYFNVSPDVVTFKSGRLGIGTLEPKATLDIRGEVLINGYQLTSMYPGFASGGDDVYDIDGYRIHAFTNSGTFTVPGNDIYADVLVVGGGGGGGQDNAGGGGAGGLIFKPMHRFGGRRVSGTPDGFYIITIGSGGAGSPEQNAGPAPKSGGDTTIKRVRSAWGNNTSYSTESFSTAIIFIAKGGGPGQNGGNTRASSLNGGSGGGQDGEVNNGSAGGTASQPTQSGDSGTYGYGNNGGASNSEAGGGGGGAGEAGGNGSSVTSGIGGNGGDGLSGVGGYDFAEIYGTRYGEVVGEDVYFAGGGAGGNKNGITGSFASGGKGGGGNAGATPSTNENGLPGTGGGGAGAFWSSGYQYNIWGGNGGSGIVMIRYKL